MNTVINAGVFIDGGYLQDVNKEKFGQMYIDYKKFAEWAGEGFNITKINWYDCLPYQSANPTEEEKERLSKKQGFFNALERKDINVRKGRLKYRGRDQNGEEIFEQKQADLLLGLDMTLSVFRNELQQVVLVTGDGDMIPAIEEIKAENGFIRHIHGPEDTYESDLKEIADDSKGMTKEVLEGL